jgi:hypothetical protein
VLVDCQGCPVAGAACADCVVATVLDLIETRPSHGGQVRLDPAERRAVDLFVAGGLLTRRGAARAVTQVVGGARSAAG